MNTKTVEDFLRRELGLILQRSQEEIPLDHSLSSLGLNSMSFVELLISVEREYGIKLINADLSVDDLASVSALAARIVLELDD